MILTKSNDNSNKSILSANVAITYTDVNENEHIVYNNNLIPLFSRMIWGDTYSNMSLDQHRFIQHYIAAMKDVDLTNTDDIYGDILDEYILFDKFLGGI